MKIKLENTQDIAVLGFDGIAAYNTAVLVPVGHEALYVQDGQVTAVLTEGENRINEASAVKAVFSKNKQSAKIYIVNRTKQFRALWGTGGIPYTAAAGEKVTAGASGSYEYALDNSTALLRKFGFPDKITEDDVRAFLKGSVTATVKEEVLAEISRGGANVGARAGKVEEAVTAKLEKVFSSVGLFLDRFSVEEITDLYE